MGQSQTTLAEPTDSSNAFLNRDSWIDRAVCVDLDYDWFPDATSNVGSPAYKKRKRVLDAVCASCSVQFECLDEALRLADSQDVFGVRAGTTQHDRVYLRRTL